MPKILSSIWLLLFKFILQHVQCNFDCKVDNFNTTYNGKSSEESHSSSNSWQHVNKFGCPVFCNFVKSCCIKVDPQKSQFQFRIKFLNRRINYNYVKSFPFKPLNSVVVLSKMYIFLNFLYWSVAFPNNMSHESNDWVLEYPETTSPEQGLKAKKILF